MPNLCHEKLKAEKIAYNCLNKYVPYDGEFLKHLVILDGGGAATTEVTDPTGCSVDNAKVKLADDETDIVCRQHMEPRRHVAHVAVGTAGSARSKVYISGGYTNLTDIGEDVWYRGEFY